MPYSTASQKKPPFQGYKTKGDASLAPLWAFLKQCPEQQHQKRLYHLPSIQSSKTAKPKEGPGDEGDEEGSGNAESLGKLWRRGARELEQERNHSVTECRAAAFEKMMYFRTWQTTWQSDCQDRSNILYGIRYWSLCQNTWPQGNPSLGRGQEENALWGTGTEKGSKL